MFRIWAKMWKENHLIKDYTYGDDRIDTRTHKIFMGMDEVCRIFDLEKPIWLDRNVKEFKRMAKTRFYQDNFIEEIEFDFLEIHIIEED